MFDRAQERVERDDGLARTDVSLQQALHRHGAREIGVEFGDRPLLMLRQFKGERFAVAGDQLARLSQRRCGRRFPLARRARDAELQNEQLVEGEPRASGLRLLE